MLTPKQQKVYDIINEYIRHHGQSPTLDELQESLGLKNKHSVVQFLEYLDQKGYIEKGRGYRSIRLRDRIIGNQLMIGIPILGVANAGRPLMYAESSDVRELQLSKNLLSGDPKKYFIVQVQGTSMNRFIVNEKLMTSGSYVLVDSTAKWSGNDASAYLCIVDGCATLKKIKRDGTLVYLVPESDDPSHHPIILSESDHFEINGRVVDVFNFG